MDTDPNVVEKIRELLKDISRNPFQGLGKPEALHSILKVTGLEASLPNTDWDVKLKERKGRVRNAQLYNAGFTTMIEQRLGRVIPAGLTR